MNIIWIIAKRELNVFFDSLIAYIMLVLFLGFSGFFTWLFGSDIFMLGQASLGVFFSISTWTLFFFIPAITMKMIADEKKSGTIELLLTKPVTDWQLVAGKYLACLLLIAIALMFSLPYYFTVANLGDIDHGAVWSGYLALLMLSSAYIGIGLFASSITNNQIVAFLLALFISLFFHLIFDFLAFDVLGSAGLILNSLSTQYHFDSLSRGVIDSKDLIYFISITGLGLYLSSLSLTRRNSTN